MASEGGRSAAGAADGSGGSVSAAGAGAPASSATAGVGSGSALVCSAWAFENDTTERVAAGPTVLDWGLAWVHIKGVIRVRVFTGEGRESADRLIKTYPWASMLRYLLEHPDLREMSWNTFYGEFSRKDARGRVMFERYHPLEMAVIAMYNLLTPAMSHASAASAERALGRYQSFANSAMRNRFTADTAGGVSIASAVHGQKPNYHLCYFHCLNLMQLARTAYGLTPAQFAKHPAYKKLASHFYGLLMESPLYLTTESPPLYGGASLVQWALSVSADAVLIEALTRHPAVVKDLNRKALAGSGFESPIIMAYQSAKSASRSDRYQLLEALVQAGAHLNVTHSETGDTVLHMAVMAGDVAFIDWVCGVQESLIDQKNRDGAMPLDLCQDEATRTVLLKHKASRGMPDALGADGDADLPSGDDSLAFMASMRDVVRQTFVALRRRLLEAVQDQMVVVDKAGAKYFAPPFLTLYRNLFDANDAAAAQKIVDVFHRGVPEVKPDASFMRRFSSAMAHAGAPEAASTSSGAARRGGEMAGYALRANALSKTLSELLSAMVGAEDVRRRSSASGAGSRAAAVAALTAGRGVVGGASVAAGAGARPSTAPSVTP